MNDEERIRECQKEILRLRSVVRNYANSIEALSHTGANALFDIWTNFDDDTISDDVRKTAEERQLGTMGSLSFYGQCAFRCLRRTENRHCKV
jgi:hypothetical protein